MSLRPSLDKDVPAETRKVAKAAFPKGNVYLWMQDELGELYKDDTKAPMVTCRHAWPGEAQVGMPAGLSQRLRIGSAITLPPRLERIEVVRPSRPVVDCHHRSQYRPLDPPRVVVQADQRGFMHPIDLQAQAIVVGACISRLTFDRRVDVVNCYRRVVDRVHRDRHRRLVRVDSPVVGHISEAVRAAPVRRRGVAERAVRVKGQQPVEWIAHHNRGQGIAIRVAVVAQHAWRSNSQRYIFIGIDMGWASTDFIPYI